jgi:hypothetical protein
MFSQVRDSCLGCCTEIAPVIINLFYSSDGTCNAMQVPATFAGLSVGAKELKPTLPTLTRGSSFSSFTLPWKTTVDGSKGVDSAAKRRKMWPHLQNVNPPKHRPSPWRDPIPGNKLQKHMNHPHRHRSPWRDPIPGNKLQKHMNHPHRYRSHWRDPIPGEKLRRHMDRRRDHLSRSRSRWRRRMNPSYHHRSSWRHQSCLVARHRSKFWGSHLSVEWRRQNGLRALLSSPLTHGARLGGWGSHGDGPSGWLWTRPPRNWSRHQLSQSVSPLSARSFSSATAQLQGQPKCILWRFSNGSSSGLPRKPALTAPTRPATRTP